MALPTQTQIVTMDYPSRGLPFVDSAAKSTIDTNTMDYPSRGLPFVVNPYGAVAPPSTNNTNAIWFGANF